jgi:DNA phosphorothioation-dependent restriction protein DptH
MNNLLAESLSSLILHDCDKAFINKDKREVRIFTASFSPEIILEALEVIENGIYKKFIDIAPPIIKISKPLWDEWQNDIREDIKNTIQHKNWIDFEDKLTSFRNYKCPENYSGLVVILIGVDKVLDKGGLADFQTITEAVIWKRKMKHSFQKWVSKLHPYLIDVNESDDECICKFFETLYTYIPKDLGILSKYLSSIPLNDRTSHQLLERLYADLPNWGIPPLIDFQGSEKKRLEVFRKSMKFLNYSDYLNQSTRKKALEAIRKKRDDDNFIIDINKNDEISDKSELLDELYKYIESNNTNSRNKLIHVDFQIIETILKIKNGGTREKRAKKEVKIEGISIDAFLRAIWITIKDLKDNKDFDFTDRQIVYVGISDIIFKHDFGKGEAESIDAQRLIKTCISGLDEYLNKKVSFENGGDFEGLQIKLRLKFPHDGYSLDKSGTAAPSLGFVINISDPNDEVLHKRSFKWVINDIHEERVISNIAKNISDKLKEKLSPVLPAFNVLTFSEMFFSSDVKEANRLLMLGENDLSIINLLDKESVDSCSPQLQSELLKICEDYKNFLDEYINKGFYNVIDQPINDLIAQYVNIGNLLIADYRENDILNLFYKAFLIIPKTTDKFECHLDTAIVTGLHPATLEILQARAEYLCQAFKEILHDFVSGEEGNLTPNKSFERIFALTEIKRPILGLISNRDKKLTTNIQPFGIIHCLGETDRESLTLASQSLLQDDTIDIEQEISDKELFSLDKEGEIYEEVLRRYSTVHKLSHDGLNILAVNINDVNHLIAGINSFLKWIILKRMDNSDDIPPYHFNLRIIATSSNLKSIRRNLESWKNHWDPEKGSSLYENCVVDISYNIVDADNYESAYYNEIKSLPNLINVSFLPHFLTSGISGDNIQESKRYIQDYSSTGFTKFPIVEFPIPAKEGFSNKYRRQSLLSNRRLKAQSLHSKLSAIIKNPSTASDDFLMYAEVDFSPWEKVISALHEISDWVTCIDPYIDRKLVEVHNSDQKEREIVGFSSGLGAYGELNLSTSTERKSITQIIELVSPQLNSMFPGWSEDECLQIARHLIPEAQNLIGFSLIEATKQYKLHDLIAYAIVLKSRAKIGNTFCDAFIPIDSYSHWFDFPNARPDLLRISASLREESIHIEAEIIECKLAHKDPQYVSQAKYQVKQGLRHLIKLFQPNTPELNNLGYDSRYWWAQLHRFISIHSVIRPEKSKQIVSALESLSDGYFKICWKGYLVTFWNDVETDRTDPYIVDEIVIDPSIPYNKLGIYHYSFGQSEIKKMCIKNSVQFDKHLANKICFEFSKDANEENDKNADIDEEQIESKKTDIQSNDTEVNLPTEEYEEKKYEESSEAEVVSIGTEANELMSIPVLIPKRIKLGEAQNGQEVFWEFGHPGLRNRHFLIFGSSGVGKTYAIQTIMLEFAKQHQHSLVIDYTDGFLPSQLNKRFFSHIAPITHAIVNKPLPLNPFQQQETEIEGIGSVIENPYEVAMRVMSVFANVYKFGDQQNSVLMQVIKEGIETYSEAFDLRKLLKLLNEVKGSISTYAASIKNKIIPFVEGNPFSPSNESTWKEIYHSKNMVNILQLTSTSSQFQKIVTELCLWDLWDYAKSFGNVEIPIPVILDEIQNLNHSDSAPLVKLLREGRKFGIAAILATQTLRDLSKNAQDRLFQAGHKLFFAPAETEVQEYAKIIARRTNTQPDSWIQKLLNLKKGECISLGARTTESGEIKEQAISISITPIESRLSDNS